MKRLWILILLLSLSAIGRAEAQTSSVRIRGGYPTGFEIIDGDTVPTFNIVQVYAFTRPKDMRRYARLVHNVKKVYPYAQDAAAYLDTLDTQLSLIDNPKAQKKFVNQMEKKIVKRYTPILEKMTYSQGKVLIKLIDRQTQRTSYQLLRDFRGGFSAGFWQTVARMFKANLKDQYDKDGDDQLIEQIIILYEAGLI